MFSNIFNKNPYGTNKTMNEAITINGPNGIYSSVVFIFVNNNMTLITAPIKKAITDIIIILENPKYNPSAPINLTSPNPIASFPAINPPSKVIIKNIPSTYNHS